MGKIKDLWPFLAITLIGALLRFLQLDERALHHDESMHAYYSLRIVQDWAYQYDPMLHGPFLYYLTAVGFFLFGVVNWSVFFFPALCGSLLCLLPYALQRELNRGGAVLASLFIAISPTMVFYSRFLRHDIFSEGMHALALVGFLLAKRRNNGYWLTLSFSALVCSFANHELTYISLFLIGLFAIAWFSKHRRQVDLPALWERYKKPLVVALTVSLGIYALLFTSFLSNFNGFWHGLPNPFSSKTSLGYWLSQHSVERGQQPHYYYLTLLATYEFAALFVMLSLPFFFKKLVASPLRRFILFWFIGSLAVYSWAGERMPWLLMHPLLPMLLLAGYLLALWWNQQRLILVCAVTALLCLNVFVMLRLNFVNSSDPRETMIFVQSSNDTLVARDKILAIGERKKAAPSVVVDHELTWPFAWYLRDANILNYDPNLHLGLSDKYRSADAILIHTKFRNEVPVLPEPFEFAGCFTLRWWWVPQRANLLPINWANFQRLWQWWLWRKLPEEQGHMYFCLFLRDAS